MGRWLLPLLLVLSLLKAGAQTESLSLTEQKRFTALREYDLLSVSSNNYDINFYRCSWTVDPAVKFISGSVAAYFTVTSPTNNIVFDFDKTMTVDSVLFRGAKISFIQTTTNGLQLNFPVTIPAGQKDSTKVFYKGVPANSSAFTQGSHNSTPIIWTLSEPYGARTWWPCKDVVNDKPDSIEIIVTNPSGFISSSNGLPVQNVVNGTQRTMVWKHRYPIAAYLVAFAVTNYSVVTDFATLPSGNMPVVAYSYPESVTSFTPAVTIAKFCLQEFSKLISEYPFVQERYAQTQFGAGGGMEHQTNSFIVNSTSSLVAHELGHQWFGDKVTCGSWSDLWLNEGSATYIEYIYTELTNPSGRIPLLQTWRSNITSVSNGAVYVTDTLNEGRLFSSRLTYRKGGYLLHMLRWKLGDSTFFRGWRRYLNDPTLAYKSALSTDLQRNLQLESGQNLTEFFKDWLYGEGYPDYNATWSQKSNFDVQVKLNQTQSDPSVSFYEMPVPLLFRSATKDSIVRVEHTQNGQVFNFNIGFKADTMIIDPDLWILTKNKIAQKVLAPANGSSIVVAPNPATTQLHVALPGTITNSVKLELTNALGQVVYSKTVAGNSTQVDINTTAFAGGVYWIRVSDNKDLKTTSQVLIARK